jgi:hypothetical protein
MGRRKFAMDDATRQLTFAAEWWKAKLALGGSPDDEDARAIAQSWLEDATSLASEALQPRDRPDDSYRPLTRRILLAYPFQRWTARLLRVVYYLLLVFLLFGAVTPVIEISLGRRIGEAVFSTIAAVITYGLLALAVRAWAAWIENRAAKRGTLAPDRSEQPVAAQQFVPASASAAPRPGWYPDPSGAPGHRYWDGQQWTAVASGSR